MLHGMPDASRSERLENPKALRQGAKNCVRNKVVQSTRKTAQPAHRAPPMPPTARSQVQPVRSRLSNTCCVRCTELRLDYERRQLDRNKRAGPREALHRAKGIARRWSTSCNNAASRCPTSHHKRSDTHRTRCRSQRLVRGCELNKHVWKTSLSMRVHWAPACVELLALN